MEKILFFTSTGRFRSWLEEHHKTAEELWVGYYKKGSGRDSITWSESVDAALCFGWIDGIRKTIDDKSYKIRFTPRKKNSVWSAVNVQKVEKLLRQGLMQPEGIKIFNSRSDKKGYTVQHRNVPLSKEYQNRLKENPPAWEFFSRLAPSYKRDSIWWIMSAKREETRLKRLNILIESSEKGLKIPSLRKNER